MTFDGYGDELDLVKNERLWGIGLLTFISIFTVVDIVEDLHEGSTISHILGEVFVVSLCLAAGIFLWRRVGSNWRLRTGRIQGALIYETEEAKRWKEAHSNLLKGLGAAIEQQLQQWGLSPAEQEVALLLIKGLSFKEIALARSTSEHTVRQQAASLYRKSGIEGRSQLAAFFLEDLIAISPQKSSS